MIGWWKRWRREREQERLLEALWRCEALAELHELSARMWSARGYSIEAEHRAHRARISRMAAEELRQRLEAQP